MYKKEIQSILKTLSYNISHANNSLSLTVLNDFSRSEKKLSHRAESLNEFNSLIELNSLIDGNFGV